MSCYFILDHEIPARSETSRPAYTRPWDPPERLALPQLSKIESSEFSLESVTCIYFLVTLFLSQSQQAPVLKEACDLPLTVFFQSWRGGKVRRALLVFTHNLKIPGWADTATKRDRRQECLAEQEGFVCRFNVTCVVLSVCLLRETWQRSCWSLNSLCYFINFCNVMYFRIKPNIQ